MSKFKMSTLLTVWVLGGILGKSTYIYNISNNYSR